MITGQRSPGRGKLNIRASYILLAVCLLCYVGTRTYAAWRDSAAYKEAEPKLALNSFTGTIQAFYMKQRPLRFPNDLSEISSATWSEFAQNHPYELGADRRTLVLDNYLYIYTLSSNKTEWGVFALPVGARRMEAESFFILVNAQGVSRKWKGKSLENSDLEIARKVGIPSPNQFALLGMIEQPRPQPSPSAQAH